MNKDLSSIVFKRFNVGRSRHLVLIVLLCCWLLEWPVSAAADTCVVGDWGPFTPCTRTGVHQWLHSHSRSVLQPAGDCPALLETQRCEASLSPRPTDAATASQQALLGLLVNLPLAVSVGTSFPQAATNSTSPSTLTPELAASLAAGRQLWQQQASHTDLLQCIPFNGPVELLQKAASPIVGNTPQSTVSQAQLSAARAALAAAAKTVAVQATAAARMGTKLSGAHALAPFTQAVVFPVDSRSAPAEGGSGAMPAPEENAAADVSWSGSSSMSVVVRPSPSMTPAAASTIRAVLHDGMSNMVPWLAVQDTLPSTPVQTPSLFSAQLNMTYDHSSQSATFNSVDNQPAGLPNSLGQLLLAIQQPLMGIYGLALSSVSAKQQLMNLPTTSALVNTNAGGGVKQLALHLSGAWTQANLTAVLGLQQGVSRLQQHAPNEAASFTIQDPAVLFSAVPSALYVAVQTNVPSLGVQDAPATINLKPGGAAALTLFEPCVPVAGLQLRDVQLHLQPEGNLTGVASGTLASTAVSALATVSPTQVTRAPTGADQDLSLVMTAETVGAGKLADVITIITRHPPQQLLQSLRHQEQQQQRMQFSSVTLTYSSPKTRRRRHRVGPSDGEPEDSGFNMVAVPDVNTAPALKQMLDAIGLSHDSLTLRAGSSAGVGPAFALAAHEPFKLQLPAPLTQTGPAALSLQVGGQSASRQAPADTLLATSLVGSATAGVQLPGSGKAVSLDLSTVTVTTPTAIVGASGISPRTAPVTAELSGKTLSQVAIEGLAFLQFGTLNVSAKAGFEPLQLHELQLSGPLTAFGVVGSTSFSQSSTVVQQEGSTAVQMDAYLPSVHLPMMARALGVNMSLGAFSAVLQSTRAHSGAAERSTAGAAGPHNSQDTNMPVLSMTAELQVLGMSSYVSFDVSAQRGASVGARFVAGQINKVIMPNLLSSVTSAMKAAQATLAAAAQHGQVAATSLADEAKEAVSKARQQVAAAQAAFSNANKQAVSKLQQAAADAEAATATYNSARIQGGSALAQARDELNAADMAFNRAKTLTYNNLNSAQQAYKESIEKYEAAVNTAQQRVDSLLSQALQLRADYNTANMLCTTAAEALQHCQAAAAAWVKYHTASAALDSAQTALQEVATTGSSAQELRRAKDSFAAQQVAADDVLSGREWAAHAAAAAKLQAAVEALQEAHAGTVAGKVQSANAALVKAQAASQAVLSPSGSELKAVSDAKQSLRAARASLKAATAAGRLTPEELSAAAHDLDSLIAQVQGQAASTAQDPAAAASGLIRFDALNLGIHLLPEASPVLIRVSYSGVVGSGDQTQQLTGSFQVDVSLGDEELGITVCEVLRDAALDALKALHRSLSPVL